MNEKFCKYCNLTKNLDDYNKCSFTSDGLQYRCRECEKKYKQENKEKIKNRMKLYHSKPEIKEIRHLSYLERYKNCKEKMLEKSKLWRKNNKEKINVKRKQKYNENLELSRQKANQKRLNNLEYYRKYQREWTKRKRQENPRYSIEHRLRNRILDALKRQNGKKAYKTIDLIGCNIDFFLKYIESLFIEGMSWNEFRNRNIEIDHILPCCQFNLLDENEQKKCFNYKNLRPIWKEDHYIKSKEDKKLSIKNKI